MAGLQRSEISFRRSGSSGLIWDDKLLSGELKPVKTKEEEDREKAGSTQEPKPARQQAYKTTVDDTPTVDPPSPRVSGCGICGMFGKPVPAQKRRRPGHHRKS